MKKFSFVCCMLYVVCLYVCMLYVVCYMLLYVVAMATSYVIKNDDFFNPSFFPSVKKRIFTNSYVINMNCFEYVHIQGNELKSFFLCVNKCYFSLKKDMRKIRASYYFSHQNASIGMLDAFRSV